MGFHLIEPETEREAILRSPAVLPSKRYGTLKPSRGPKFTGVLSAKYTDDETGLAMYQLRAYSPELGRFIKKPKESDFH